MEERGGQEEEEEKQEDIDDNRGDAGDSAVLPSYAHKVQPLMDSVMIASRRLVRPQQWAALDEMMVRFSGRSRHVYLIKMKPNPKGYKLMAICTAGGYCYAIIPVSRSTSTSNWKHTANIPEAATWSATERIVAELCMSLPNQGRGYNVAMDNYFTTRRLFKFLRSRGIGAVGTARPSPGESRVPKRLRLTVKEAKKATHNMVGWLGDEDGAVAMTWIDNNRVHFLSNIHDPAATVTKVRRRPSRPSATVKAAFGNNHEKEMPFPTVAADYNQHMGYCDIADQKRSYYTPLWRSRRNWMPMLIAMLEVAMINAHIVWELLAKSHPVPSMKHVDFRKTFVSGVLQWNREQQAASNSNKRSRSETKAAASAAAANKRQQGHGGKHVAKNAGILPDSRFDESEPHWPIVFSGARDGSPMTYALGQAAVPEGARQSKGKAGHCCDYCRFRQQRQKAAGVPALKYAHKSHYVCSNPVCNARLCIEPARNCFVAYHTTPPGGTA